MRKSRKEGRSQMKYVLLFLLSGVAYANDEEEPKVIYKQKTEIDFDGVEVDGTLVKPQGSLLLERKHAKFNPMISRLRKLNETFDGKLA